MAKIVNQNDIMNVIEDSMKNTASILDCVKNIAIVVKSIQKEKVKMSTINDFLTDFQQIIPTIATLQNVLNKNLNPKFEHDYSLVFIELNKILKESIVLIQTVQKIPKTKILFAKISDLIITYKLFTNLLTSIVRLSKNFITKSILNQFKNIKIIINMINDINLIPTIYIKLIWLRMTLYKLIKLIIGMNKFDIISLFFAKLFLISLNKIILILKETINSIASMDEKVLVFSYLYLRKIKKLIKRLYSVILTIQDLSIIKVNFVSVFKTLSFSILIFKQLQWITLILDNIKAGFFFRMHLKGIIKVVKSLSSLIFQLNLLPRPKINTIIKLRGLMMVLISLFKITTAISLLAITVLPAALLIWPVVLATSIIVKGLRIISIILKGVKLRKLSTGLLGLNLVLLSLLILNVTLLLLVISVQEMLQPQRMLLLLGYLTFICIFALAIKLMVWIIKSLVSFKGLISLIAFMAIIGILTIITTMLFVMSIMAIKVIQNIGSIFLLLLSIIAIIGSIAIIGLMMSLLTPIIPFILLGVLAMVVLIGAFFILAVQLFILQFIHLDKEAILNNVNIIMDTAFAVINSIFNQVIGIEGSNHNTPWYEKVIRFIGGSAVTLITAILAVGFLALTVVAIGLILFMAAELRLLQTIDLNKEAILKNVSIVTDTALSVISSIFDRKDDKGENPSNKNYFLTILEKFCQPFASIFQAIMAVGFLALTVVAITLILFLATELRILQTINLDKATISANVSTVIDTAQFVINKIIAPDNSNPSPAKKGIFDKLLDFVLPDGLKNMIDAMMAIGFLAVTKVAIGLVVDIANNLTALTKLPSLSNVIPNVDSAIICAQNIVNRIINNDKIQIDDDQAEMVANTVENLKVISSLMNQLQIVMKSVQSIPVVDAEIITQSKTTVSAILGLLDETNIKTPIPTVKVRLDQLNYLQKIIKDFSSITPTQVKNSEAILKNYSQFLEKVNSSNLEGLKTTTNMFEKMSEFSKSINGNFDALAQTLNDKIAPLLEELKEIMDGVQEKIEKTGSDISSSVYASSQGSLSRDEMAQQTSREMPNASTEDQAKKTEQRMQEQAQRQNNDIASKLDELIDLFRNGMAFVRTT